MRKLSTLLSALLSVQLLLAAGIYWHSAGASQSAAQPLLANASAASQIAIEAAGQSLTLQKQGERWLLDNHLPADAGKVNQLVSELSALRTGWALATSESAQTRFEVAADKFNRKITLQANNQTLPALFVGKAAGFKKSHLRLASRDEIYTGALNSYSLETDRDSWLDKSLLAIDKPEQITSRAIKLSRKDDQWQWDQSEPLDQTKAKALAQAWQNLRVTGLSDYQGNGTDALLVTLRSDGQEWQYKLLKQDNQALIQRQDRPQWFKLATASYEALTNKALAKQTQTDQTKTQNKEKNQ